MFRTFAQFLFKLLFPEGQGGMKETFGNSGGEGGFIFLHKNGNSGEVGGLSWNSLRGGGMDIFWNYTLKTKKSTTASHCRALVNIRHSVFVMKYAKTCTGIFGANFLTTIEQIIQLCYALKALPKRMFFDLIRLLLFEKRLS